MIFFVIAFLAITGLLTSIGLIVFHLIILFSKSKNLALNILISMIFSALILMSLSQIPYNTYEIQLEKHVIFYTILLNHILIVLFVRKLMKQREEYFSMEDKTIRVWNKIALVVYIATVAIYLLMSYLEGLAIGWEAITR